MAVTTPLADIGWTAPDFALKGVDNKVYKLNDLTGERATLVMFICNHCPYVKAIMPRMVRDAAELLAMGIGVIAINSNDADAYPEDSFSAMQTLSQNLKLPFMYLYDESQQVARAYDAVCTPDFYGFDTNLKLQYRGRLDASRREAGPENAPRELFDAMRMIADTGQGPAEQHASMGCSIKWREA